MIHAYHIETAMFRPDVHLKCIDARQDTPPDDLVREYAAGHKKDGRDSEERDKVGKRARTRYDIQSQMVIGSQQSRPAPVIKAEGK